MAISWRVQPAGGPDQPGPHRYCSLVQGSPVGTEERWNSGLDGRDPKADWAAESVFRSEQDCDWWGNRWVFILPTYYCLLDLSDFAGPLFLFCPSLAAVVEASAETTAATEPSKLSALDKVQQLTDRITQSVTDLSRTRPDQTGPGGADKGRWVRSWSSLNTFLCILFLLALSFQVCWCLICACFLTRWVKVTVAVGEETEGVQGQRRTTDADVISLEQTGRVTGWW